MRKEIEDSFKKQFLWKILQEKQILQDVQDAKFRSSMSANILQLLKKQFESKIAKLRELDQKKITDVALKQAHQA
jgi:hypothetical protein